MRGVAFVEVTMEFASHLLGYKEAVRSPRCSVLQCQMALGLARQAYTTNVLTLEGDMTTTDCSATASENRLSDSMTALLVSQISAHAMNPEEKGI